MEKIPQSALNTAIKPNGLIVCHKLKTDEYVKRLIENLTFAMRSYGLNCQFEKLADGVIMFKVDEVKTAITVTSKVFGVSSVSPAVLGATSDEVAFHLATLFKDISNDNKTYAISVKNLRSGRHINFIKEAGEAVPAKGDVKSRREGFQKTEVLVDVLNNSAYVSLEGFQGLGGLPLGSQGKVVCLVSGGIDSPVAAWLTMRKGCAPVFIYYDNYPFTDKTTTQRALDVVEKLGEYTRGCRVKLYVIPHGGDLTAILRNCPRKLTCILCRRMMYRVSERVAAVENAEAIVTGEILGEHASQTSRNLAVINTALKEARVLRPLIGMDKLEVESLARKIGTFEISTRPGLCCVAPPKRPITHADPEEVENAEFALNIDSIIEGDLEKAKIIEI